MNRPIMGKDFFTNLPIMEDEMGLCELMSIEFFWEAANDVNSM